MSNAAAPIGALAFLLAGCAAATQPQGGVAQSFVPAGAKIEPSGYATITWAPPRIPDQPPRAWNPPQSEAEVLAAQHNISIAEAQRLLAERLSHETEAMRVRALVGANEKDNFVEWRIDHYPEVRWTFFFKRDPEATLRKYTRDPRMRAAQAASTFGELNQLAEPWTKLLTQRGLMDSWGINATEGKVTFSIQVPEAEFRAIARRENWQLPSFVELHFPRELAEPAVDPRASPFIRIFPQSDRDPTIILTSATGSKVALIDGCFRVGSTSDAPLAYFAHAAGLTIDGQGYLVFRSRSNADELARVGEWASWGGYGPVREDMPRVRELRQKCGDGPIVHVGVPNSIALSSVRYGQVEEVMRRRGVGRERAWALIADCLKRRTSRPSDKPPNLECP